MSDVLDRAWKVELLEACKDRLRRELGRVHDESWSPAAVADAISSLIDAKLQMRSEEAK